MNDYTHSLQKLTKELTNITKDLEELGIQNPQVPQDWIATPSEKLQTEADTNITADRTEDWQVRRAEVAVLEKRYNNIVRAIQKIKEGNFGVCEICGEKIENDRLAIHPAARTDKAHMEQEDTLPL